MCDGHTGPTGPIGCPGPRGDDITVSRKEYPHGWTENSHADIRGAWGAASEAELLGHLIYWLEQCRRTGPSMRDPAGNAYYGVDGNVVKQTLESLRRYQGLFTQPLGKQIADVGRDVRETTEGPKGVY